ncbi:MAG: hypothetical protein LBH52_02620 [Puniceicoccales bacterium]|jgi:hypothetical protein|nr:hypothetical protein [Puniceicoccales bacterium]
MRPKRQVYAHILLNDGSGSRNSHFAIMGSLLLLYTAETTFFIFPLIQESCKNSLAAGENFSTFTSAMVKKIRRRLFTIIGLIFLTSFTFLVLLFSFSFGQKILLYSVLSCLCDHTQIVNYQGNWNAVKIDALHCRRKNFDVKITDFNLQWQPWRFFLGHGLHIQTLEGHVHCNVQDPKSKVPSISPQQAGFIFSRKKDKCIQGPLKHLRLPFRVYLENLNLQGQGTYKNLTFTHCQATLKNVCPDKSAEGNYTAQIKIADNAQVSQVNLSGHLQLAANAKGHFTKLRLTNQARIRNQSKLYPLFSLNIFAEDIQNRQKEYLQVDGHYGPSNDLQITCDFLDKGPQNLMLKWQGLFDHTLFKIFSNNVPTLSIMANGEISVNRAHLDVDTHTYVSAWMKQLETLHASLSNLPVLSLKTELDASIRKNNIEFKQFNCLLKQKNTRHVFLTGNLMQALIFHTKSKNFKTFNQNKKIFDLNLQNIPCETLTPLLVKYGYKLQGQLNNGVFEFLWDSSKREWSIQSVQPVRISQCNLQKHDQVVIKNLQVNIHPNVTFSPQLDQLTYEIDLQATDPAYQKLFQSMQRGQIKRADKKLQQVKLAGQLHVSSKALLQQPIAQPWLYAPYDNLDASVEYDFKWDKCKNLVLLDKFNMQVHDSDTDNMRLNVQLNQPVPLSLKAVKQGYLPDLKGDVLSVECHKIPLDFVNLFQKRRQISGLLSWAGGLKTQDQYWLLYSNKDFLLESANLSCMQALGTLKPCLHLETCRILPSFKYYEDKKLTCHLDNIYFQGELESKPLLKGNVQATVNLNNGCKVEQSQGQLHATLDDLNFQPILSDFSGVLGDCSIHWNADKNIMANYHFNITPLTGRCTFDGQGIVTSHEKNATVFHLQGPIELRHPQHLTDLNLDLNCDFGNTPALKGHMDSQSIYVVDVKEMYDFFKAWFDMGRQKMASLPLGIAEKTKPNPSDRPSVNHSVDPHVLPKPFWYPWHVNLNLTCNNVTCGQTSVKNFNTTCNLGARQLEIKSTCEPFSGHWITDLTLQRNAKDYDVTCNLCGKRIDVAQSINCFQNAGVYPKNFPAVRGTCDLSANLHTQTDLKTFPLDNTEGKGIFECTDGDLKFFQQSSTTAKAIGGLTNTLGLLVGGKVTEMGTLGFLTAYCQSIPFQKVAVTFQKSLNEALTIQQAHIKNDDFALYVQGTIGMDPQKKFQEQDIHFDFQLNGKEGPWVRYFSFDTQNTDPLGYFMGPKFYLDGTLQAPNCSDLLKLLNTKKTELPHSSPKTKLENTLQQIFQVL